MAVENPVRLLFVEDDENLRLLGEVSLSIIQGLELTMAEDGDEAVALIKQGTRFRIVATDNDMPGVNQGLDVAAFAKKTDPDVRIILLSASDVETIKTMDINRVVDIYFQKPHSPREFTNTVRGLVDQIQGS